MSSIVHKIKEAIHPDSHKDATHKEGTHGPHDSKIANAADPRIDSDRDGSHTAGTTGTHTGAYTGTHTGNHSHTAGNAFGSGGPAPNTDGPHKNDLLNKADPRVDADRDGSKTIGGDNYGSTGFGSNTHGTHTQGSNPFGTTNTHAEGTHGTHSSRLANAADPRIDSDRDGSRTVGGNAYGSAGTTGASGFGSGPAPNTAGPHSNDLFNKADPRVDADRDGSHTLGSNAHGTHNTHQGAHTTAGQFGAAIGGTHGTGPAPNTAGPHKNDMLNKVDPRVDSNLDGSKTVGGNQTYSQS